MTRVLAIITKRENEIIEYVVIEDRSYPSMEAFLAAGRRETETLSERHRLPNDDLELFDGCDRSLESFFRMFPNLKLTPRSARLRPNEPRS